MYKWLKTHMKKCSASLSVNEMQIKTILRFYLILVGMATIKNTNNKWQGCGEEELSYC
jgi:hypothetical protein